MLLSALIFPGQGAQSVGMGKEFYDASPEAKAIFEQADTLIPELTDVMFNGPQERLTETKYCQPAIFTFSIAALEAFKASEKFKNITPKFTCGLSLGEYSALVASGALSFQDGLKLVIARSGLMEEACKQEKGAMAAVLGMPKEKVVQICLECQAEVANFNAPDQIVITGKAANVIDAMEVLKQQGAKRVIPLDVSGAFHSSLMTPAAEAFKAELAKTTFQSESFPVIHNVSGRPSSGPEYFERNLSDQITSSVQWVDSINYISGKGVTTFFEIGPGNVLKGLIRKIDRALTVHNIQTPQDIESLEVPATT